MGDLIWRAESIVGPGALDDANAVRLPREIRDFPNRAISSSIFVRQKEAGIDLGAPRGAGLPNRASKAQDCAIGVSC